MNISSSQITFGGLATGIDSRAIIDALLGVEQIPIIRLQNQKSFLDRQDGIFSSLDGLLNDLKAAMEGMDTVAELASYAATSSDETRVGVTASGNAEEGTHQVEVLALAAAESRATGGYADRDTTNIGNGTFAFTVDGQNYTVDLSQNATNTLQDVRDAINDSGAPVSASIINNGTANEPFQLVISSNDTGAQGAFSVDLTGFSGFDPAAFYIDDVAQSQLQEGIDSHIRIDGLNVYRSTNTISDVIDGITLDLNAADPGNPIQITVNTDTEGVKEKVQSFIDAYNSNISVLDGQNQVDDEGQTSAALFGDSSLRSIAARLRTAVTHQASSSSSLYDSLAALGITSDADGKLNLEGSTFDDALSADFDGVMEFFTDISDGSAATFKTAVDDLTDPVSGIIKIRRDGISNRKDAIDGRIERMEDRLSSYEDRLVQRFANLETLVSSFQAQGAALSSFPTGGFSN